MGADIHYYVEKRTEKGWKLIATDDDVWGYWRDQPDKVQTATREYSLWFHLAGVRSCYEGCDEETRAIPNGWPDDICLELERIELEDADLHSHMSFLLSEVESLPDPHGVFSRSELKKWLTKEAWLLSPNTPKEDIRILLAWDN